ASARVRTSRKAGAAGRMRATVSPALTSAPALSGTRRSWPLTGAETTYSLRTRVRTSSRTATIIGPDATCVMSTGTGNGRNAYASSAATMTSAATQNTVRNGIFMRLSFSAHQDGHEVHAIETPPHREPRHGRHDNDDGRPVAVRAGLYHERQTKEVRAHLL